MFQDMSLGRIKMVAVDLDGTLLKPGGTLSPRTKKAVRDAQRKGIKVIPATGKTASSAAGVARILRLKSPLIASNGAHVVSQPPREDLLFTPIKAETYLEIVKLLRSENLPFMVHTRSTVVRERQFVKKTNGMSLMRKIGPYFGGVVYDDMKLMDDESYESLAGEVLKIFISGSISYTEKLESQLSPFIGEDVTTVKTLDSHGGGLFEIHAPSINKGTALLWLGQKLGIAKEQIAAIGDGDNDISMVEAAGLGVAMANASPALAEVADCFTLSSQQDGVAVFLEEVMGQKEKP